MSFRLIREQLVENIDKMDLNWTLYIWEFGYSINFQNCKFGQNGKINRGEKKYSFKNIDYITIE